MISHLPLRLAASALTLAVVLQAPAARCQAHVPMSVMSSLRVMSPAATTEHVTIVDLLGSGSPVVLIPGLSSPRETWDGVAQTLSSGHRVIVVQVNGFAGDDPHGNLKPGILDGVVADLHAYLAHEKLAGTAVVGHSLGGLVALKLALAHPGDAGRLMIVDALPFYGRLFGPAVTPAMLEPRGAAMRDAIAATYGKPADEAAAQKVADGLALKPASRAAVKGWAMKADPRVTGQAMYEDLTTDVTADLPRIAVPVTLVVPYKDAASQAKADALYRDAYTGAAQLTVVEVADSAHFVMLDQPAAFSAALAAFLR